MEIVVHRGANKVAPENTQASAEACIALGVDFVEIDVRLSKDGIPFILHDPTVDRTTNGSGVINDLTAVQIEALDAGSWFDLKFSGQKIPRLETYLQWIEGKAKVFLDMKDPLLIGENLKTIVYLVDRLGMEDDCFFGFQESTAPSARALELAQIAPHLLLKINADTLEQVQQAKHDYHANIVETSVNRLTENYKTLCQELELKTMLYEFIWNDELYQKAMHSGADLINLDDPERFLQVKHQLEKRA